MTKDTSTCNTDHNLLHTLLYGMKEFSFLSEKHLEKKLQDTQTELSLSQVIVLISVSMNQKRHESLSQCKIADFLHVTEATISKHIKSLITHGYLKKNERKETKRGNDISLSEKGIKELNISLTVINSHVETLLSPLTEEEKATLRIILQKLLQPLL